MKATTLTKVFTATLALFLFQGCMSYEANICSDENAVEIPGLEGTKTFRLRDADGKPIVGTLTYEYLGEGWYRSSSEAENVKSRACAIENGVILESQQDQFSRAMFVETLGEDGFLLSTPDVHEYDLLQAGIPFEYQANSEITTFGQFLPQSFQAMVKDEDEKGTLFVLNADPEANEKFKKLLRPSILGFAIR